MWTTNPRSVTSARRLANPLISPLRVMPGFIPEMAEMAGANGKSIMLPMEQSRIADGFACLLLSIRPGERALPLTGEVRETCAKSDLMGIGHLANLTCETIVCPRCSKHNRIGPSRGLISQVKSRFSQTQCPIWLWPDLLKSDRCAVGRCFPG